MKEKGFDKPVKYIFIGEPNTTKTWLAERTGLRYFETDGLTENQLLDISSYPRDADIIIIGGKWINYAQRICYMLHEAYKEDYHLIEVKFKDATLNTLKFVIERHGSEVSDSIDYDVYIATENNICVVALDGQDGYRSSAEVVPESEVDPLQFWLKIEGGKEKVLETEYDRIEFNRVTGSTEYLVRAFLNGKVVFEIGTWNIDDYYPSYFLTYKGKGIEALVEELGLVKKSREDD